MTTEVSKLRHVKRAIPGGGVVYILDNGATIDSEGEAMLQALHSRSTGGFESHMSILEEKGAKNFMKNFYVGYGHKSIGDCGSITIFIEGVSILAAKAIQDSKLYSGQESSTRYIDFSKQTFLNPTHTKEGETLLASLRELYLSSLEPTIKHLQQIHPQGKDEKESIYTKAIKARAFDILRGFLPAGVATNLAWHSNLRQVADKLLFLRHHPLKEVRDIAVTIDEAVRAYYPDSFSHEIFENTENYQDLIAKQYYYHNKEAPDKLTVTPRINKEILQTHKELLTTRPIKTELPKYLSHAGTIQATFQLDFGSFRDIQRHRSLDQRMPLLTTDLGFNKWYLEQLPTTVRKKAENCLAQVEKTMAALGCTEEIKQYYTPMGYNLSCLFTGDLPATVYVVELRATRFVHPTLRKIALELGTFIDKELGVPIHFDEEPDRFDIKRGEQDIVLK